MYVIDANVFIDAKNRHYGLDFAPGFWDWLVEQNNDGSLCSIADVKKELDAGKDELSKWATTNSGLFVALDPPVQASMQTLSTWANSGTFTGAAVNTFLAGADYPLVAFAHAHSHTVVTHERSQPNAKKRILIPDACTAIGVNCVDPFTMLRSEGAKFVCAN
ncbi:hypothetical protein MINS_09200 [Mycolicibacterium insubricum]|uniref:Uncharacterized protein n=1 Tax=Mycolicibacterium insubricum TaxID=444597 RepID=A0A1X0DET2_9MYCO|nr:DUF4411 family protein [Mycolicibacterium insubricum]MCV7082090.1 DUF4411 family protein [Mycolicibacterium insubricum]ORA70904.1 hypothetical protein BST26_09440 [Mycolicibacterium insubricum]BBZ65491.1 hypothetical protein MINS_09200 [Mycolicibacterium insubricum]